VTSSAGITHLADSNAASAIGRRKAGRHPSVIPGFGITLGLTLSWLALIVLTPIATASVNTITLVGAGLRQRDRSANRRLEIIVECPIFDWQFVVDW